MAKYPGGKRFAFAIIDDTDVGTVENLLPIYRLLEKLGMGASKTVWPMSCPEESRDFSSSQTLEDDEYREFVLDLQRRGFEIAWHCATMESSKRERTQAGLERFRAIFGAYPRVHANHAFNRENLYWGVDRVDDPLIRSLYGWLNGTSRDYFLGHVEGSPYWWGDLCSRHVDYVRNLTFNELNLRNINPTMPYRDPSRPLVRWWFSAADAEDCAEFRELIRPERLDQLEEEGGFCIVATHFGKEFVKDGLVDPVTSRRLESLSRRPGWYPNVVELLDWLRETNDSDTLPKREWKTMQRRWARDLALRKWRQRRRRRTMERGR